MTQPMYINPDADTAIGTATIASVDDTFTITAHGLEDEDRIVVSNLTGGAVGEVAEGGVYWVRDVTADTFTITASRRGLPIEFAADGGADIDRFEPGYDARELRRMMAGMLYPDPSGDYLDARQGILPAKQPFFTLSGSDWTVFDNVFVINPGITSTSGPYLAYLLETANTLAPADGSNDRIDAIDIQIQDHDEDTSGFRRARLVFTTGSPGSGEPAPVANAYRALTFLVPQSGTGDPSINSRGDMTVMRGGVLPVRSDSELPAAASMPDGAVAQNIETGALLTTASGAWETIASRHGYVFGGRVIFLADDTFDKADYPGLRAIDVTCIGGGGGAGGCAGTGSGEASEGAGGGGGGGSRMFILASALAVSENVLVGSGGNGGASGNNNGSSGGDSVFEVTGAHPNPSGGGGGGGAGGSASSSNTVADGGAVGTGSSGDINVTGDAGGNGAITGGESSKHNYGGGSGFGYGGQSVSAAFTSAGAPGSNYGGGAGGPRNNDNQGSQPGRNGAGGIVIVDLYY